MSDEVIVNDPDQPADSASPDALQRERDELHDRLLRVTAEFDNYRKRTDRERRELSDAVAGDFARDLLPATDDLERALAAPAVAGDQVLRAGVELIHRQLIEALRRRGVTAFESVGQQFDPAWHEALAGVPAEGRPDGEIVSEVRRGYRIGSRLLRPALVQVAKA
jgi:molecular chaperone GrpE